MLSKVSYILQFPVFSLGFCSESPFLLAAGGKGESDKQGGDSLERITILKTNDYLPIQNAFPQAQNKSV